MSASKASASKSFARRATKPLPTIALQPQPPTPVPVQHDSLTNDADDEESFFDDLDDTFELALSQLDETAVAPTPPSSLGAASRKPALPGSIAPLTSKPNSSHLAPPAARPIPRPAPPARNASDSSTSSSKIVLRTSRTFTRTMSAEAQREMEELAKRELEAIADSFGADGSGWSDEDF
ncbi:Proteophosphoglycan 5 [Rhodotorula toruloides]|nr:Proteophosphoglycan 5 [Rhodotorula toruloides]